MSVHTSIQWCHSAANPVMGCAGCELWTTRTGIGAVVDDALNKVGHPGLAPGVKLLLQGKSPTDIYHQRSTIASTLVESLPNLPIKHRNSLETTLASAIAAEFKCYAGLLHLWRGVNESKPAKRGHPGYARKFEELTLFPGRMKQAAAWSDLRSMPCPEKPWLDGLSRMIFISDMGDALSPGVEFEYLKQEIIENVASANGSRHIWLWLTKRPDRMAKFSEWLVDHGSPWPENLVPMTSVTSAKTTGRAAQLRRVKSRFRGLSVEPLWGKVSLDLAGIDWVIVGGESALRRSDAKPFHLEWARDLRDQCHRAEVAFFMKQLGSQPVENEIPMNLADHHGGDWNEWPKDLRIRAVPKAFERAVERPSSRSPKK